MSILSGSPSLFDERSWRLDSGFRSSSYRLEIGYVSFGEVGGADLEDWYSLRLPGPGAFKVIASNDPANNFQGNTWTAATGTGLTVQMADSLGNLVTSIGSATVLANSDGTLSFTYSGGLSTADYFIRVSGLGLTSVADYVLKLEMTGGITRTGTTAADSLLGGSMDDSLDGGAGNDTLDGSDGIDTLIGQAGDDLLTGGLGNDRLDGGDGIDTASYLGATGGVSVNLAAGTATGAAGNDILISIENIWGSAYADTLVGSAGVNYFAAGQGADSVDAGAGDDLIRGGAGNDTLDGGVGNDTVYYDTARSAATVVHNSAGGQFTVSTATEGVDVVRGVETFVFAGVTYTAASLIDTTPPSAVTFSPTASALAVGVDTNITLTFSELIQRGTGTIVLRNMTSGTVVESFDAATSNRINISGSTLTLDPTVRLAFSSTLRLEIPGSTISDLAGNLYVGTSSYSFVTQADPDVITGNLSTTKTIEVGSSDTGVIDYTGDTDWWRFQGLSGYGYQIWIEGLSSSSGNLADPYVGIFSSSGAFIQANNDFGTGTRDAYTYLAVTQNGSFFVSSEEFGNDATGTYKITVWQDALASVNSAATVAVDSSTWGRIGWQNDTSDWISVQLTAGINYQFDLVGSTREGNSLALVDGWLALRGSDGNVLVADDDSGAGTNARIFFTPTVSGRYFLDVQESGLNSYGVYSLIVNQSPVRSSLTLGSAVTGSVDFLGNTDLYSVTLTAGVTYAFSVSGITLQDAYLEILDQAGRVLAVDDDGGTGLSSRLLYTATTSGTHYLAARASGNAGTGTYSALAWALPKVSIADATIVEGDAGTRSLDFVISLSAPSPLDVTLTAGTRASTASTASGDYQGIFATTVVIPAGTTSINFSIPVNGDQVFEPNEGLRAVLSDPVMAVIDDGEANGWIIDDDAPYALPTDGLVRYQWYLYPQIGVNAFPIWNDYTGSGIKVAVFDQGIDPTHPDLDGNLLSSAGRKASDLSLGGAPLLNSDNHGTMVSGTIAAERNGAGIVGVAYGAKLISIYTPFGSSSTISDIVNAYNYARNFDILNDSWGFAP